MKIPRSLKNHAARLQQNALREEQEEIKKEKAKSEHKQQEKEEQIKNGLPSAEKIFAWATEFTRDETGRTLIKMGNIYGTLDGACFFDGHVEGEARRSLGIGSRGLYWHQAGCGAREHYVYAPIQLAAKISPKILKLACEWIQTGEVFACIERRLEGRGKEREERIAAFKKRLAEYGLRRLS